MLLRGAMGSFRACTGRSWSVWTGATSWRPFTHSCGSWARPASTGMLGLPSALLSASAQPGYIEEQHLRRHVPVVTGYASTRGYGQFSGLHWAVLKTAHS